MKFKDIYGDLSDTIYKGNFDCSYNNLTSLEGVPNKVKGNFDCSNNKLTSLETLPKYYKRFNSDFTEKEYLDFCKKRFPQYLI